MPPLEGPGSGKGLDKKNAPSAGMGNWLSKTTAFWNGQEFSFNMIGKMCLFANEL